MSMSLPPSGTLRSLQALTSPTKLKFIWNLKSLKPARRNRASAPPQTQHLESDLGLASRRQGQTSMHRRPPGSGLPTIDEDRPCSNDASRPQWEGSARPGEALEGQWDQRAVTPEPPPRRPTSAPSSGPGRWALNPLAYADLPQILKRASCPRHCRECQQAAEDMAQCVRASQIAQCEKDAPITEAFPIAWPGWYRLGAFRGRVPAMKDHDDASIIASLMSQPTSGPYYWSFWSGRYDIYVCCHRPAPRRAGSSSD